MNCVVTAGPTCEPLDQVRRLTNFSTGRLGTELANHLCGQGHRVTLLLGEQATFRGASEEVQVRRFTTTADLRGQLHALSSVQADSVFHAAAVSDFRFGQVWTRTEHGELIPLTAGKLSTRQGTLLAELVPTPKIIAELRGWFPRALLVGWKYEVDGNRSDALRAAERQLADCRVNACVANGPAYGVGFGLLCANENFQHLSDAAALYASLTALLPLSQ